MFSLKPNADLDPGTRITNTASIVFDTAAAMNTNEVFNTIGAAQTNHAPALTNPGSQASAKGEDVSLQISATDADNDTLTYSATGLPSGLSIDSYTVNVSVSDGKGGTDAKSFTWAVSAAGLTGSLQVTITPEDAVTAGAQWTCDNGATWNASGATLSNVPLGMATVSFKDLDGWTTPADQTVPILPGTNATATGAYVQTSKGCGCAGGTLDNISPSKPIPPHRLGDLALLILATGLLCTSRRLFKPEG
jgi:hypothetical protein